MAANRFAFMTFPLDQDRGIPRIVVQSPAVHQGLVDALEVAPAGCEPTHDDLSRDAMAALRRQSFTGVRVLPMSVSLPIELECEDDGRWVAEVPDLPGTLCYGASRDQAIARVQALALRVLAERLEHGEAPAELLDVSFRAA